MLSKNKRKSLKQKIEEAEATLRRLNEEIENESNEVIITDEPHSAAKSSQEKDSQATFTTIDTDSPLAINIQLAKWPVGFKFNVIPTYNGQSDPRQFLMSFEAAVASRGGDPTTLAKSLIMAMKGPAQQWYSSLKPRSIKSWDQLRTTLLLDFQGFQQTELTSDNLFNVKQYPKEPLIQYYKRFVQVKAQIPNVPDEVIIIATIKGLRAGQLSSHFKRERPTTVSQLYEEMQKYCRSDDDYRKRIEEENGYKNQPKTNNNFQQPRMNNFE